MGLHRSGAGAAVGSPAWETYTDIRSNSPARTGASRLKPKVKVLPPPTPNILPKAIPSQIQGQGKNPQGSAQGPPGVCKCHAPRFHRAPSLIPIRIRENACVSRNLCSFFLTDNSSRPARCISKPPSSPPHTHARSHCGQYITSLD